MGTFLSKAAKSILAAIKEMYPTSKLNINFSKKVTRQHLNGLFMSDVLWGILEGKNYCSLVMAFLLPLHFYTGASECERDPC